jgi:hypothetical protein
MYPGGTEDPGGLLFSPCAAFGRASKVLVSLDLVPQSQKGHAGDSVGKLDVGNPLLVLMAALELMDWNSAEALK